MKILAIILNIFFPGVGSMVIGKIGTGIAQLLLYILGWIITTVTLGLGVVIGGPLCLGAWIWALITAIQAEERPLEVRITKETADGTETVTHGIGVRTDKV